MRLLTTPFPFRYVIYFFALMCITLVYSLRLAFHSTILCQYDANDTSHYLADPNTRALSYSSVSFGLMIGLLPLPWIQKTGTRNTVMVYGIIGVLASFAYPWSDAQGFLPAFVVRLIQGMPGAILLWIITKVSQEWAPNTERGLSIAIISSVYQLAPVVAMVSAGEACTRVGWEYTYYGLGGVTAFVFLVFYCLYRNDAAKSRFVTADEVQLIKAGKTVVAPGKVPYYAIFTDGQVLIAWYMYLCFFVGTYVFLQYGPVYLNQVLGYSLQKTGYYGAIPHALSMILKFVYGTWLDKCDRLSLRQRMVTAFAAVELFCIACLVMLMFVESPILGVIVYSIYNCFHGLVIVVIMKQIQIIACRHAHVPTNFNTFIVVVVIIATPYFFRWLVPDNTKEQWTVLFPCIGALIFSSVVLFAFAGRCAASSWAELQSLPNEDVPLEKMVPEDDEEKQPVDV